MVVVIIVVVTVAVTTGMIVVCIGHAGVQTRDSPLLFGV